MSPGQLVPKPPPHEYLPRTTADIALAVIRAQHPGAIG
jgi:hypothetical protein